VLRQAKRMVFCEGDVRAQDGNLVAKALGTFQLRHRS